MINGVDVIGTVLVFGIFVAWVLLSVMLFVMFQGDDNDDMEKRE